MVLGDVKGNSLHKVGLSAANLIADSTLAIDSNRLPPPLPPQWKALSSSNLNDLRQAQPDLFFATPLLKQGDFDGFISHLQHGAVCAVKGDKGIQMADWQLGCRVWELAGELAGEVQVVPSDAPIDMVASRRFPWFKGMLRGGTEVMAPLKETFKAVGMGVPVNLPVHHQFIKDTSVVAGLCCTAVNSPEDATTIEFIIVRLC